MRLSTLSASTLVVGTALGYLDTAPFFMFSTVPHLKWKSTTSIQRAESVNDLVRSFLQLCPSKQYVIVHQAGVSTSDYTNSKTTPALASYLQKSAPGIGSSYIASEVVGQIDPRSWQEFLVEECNASPLQIDGSSGFIPPRASSSNLLTISFPAPLDSSKSAELNKHDTFLGTVLDSLSSNNYSVIYTTSISTQAESSMFASGNEENAQYEMETPLSDMPHAELKRDLGLHRKRQDSGNETLVDGPLFDRYQFFTPGIWMGYFIGILLLLILYVGFSALSGLQVTYAAFEKESGPSSSSKAQ